MAETSKAWDEPNPRETERMRPAASLRGGMNSLPEDMEMKAKLSTLARMLEELEMRNQHEVRAVAEAPVPNQPCFICQSTDHQGEHCPTIPSVRDWWLNKPMLWAHTSHHPLLLTATNITLTGGTTLISHGNQSLHHMCPLLHNSSMVPLPSHNHHHPHR